MQRRALHVRRAHTLAPPPQPLHRSRSCTRRALRKLRQPAAERAHGGARRGLNRKVARRCARPHAHDAAGRGARQRAGQRLAPRPAQRAHAARVDGEEGGKVERVGADGAQQLRARRRRERPQRAQRGAAQRRVDRERAARRLRRAARRVRHGGRAAMAGARRWRDRGGRRGGRRARIDLSPLCVCVRAPSRRRRVRGQWRRMGACVGAASTNGRGARGHVPPFVRSPHAHWKQLTPPSVEIPIAYPLPSMDSSTCR
ncbi:IucA/IucC family protein [Gracilaria domingensis]|nr:IucA/IucC family protein [Gracilaria domingensis]